MLRLLPMIMSMAAIDVQAAIKRRKRNGVIYALAGLMLLSAWICGLWAVVAAIAQTAGPVAAPLYIMIALVAFALVLFGVVAAFNAYERRQDKKKESPVPAVLLAGALTMAPALLRSRSLVALLTIAGAGFAAYRFSAGGDDNHS